MVLEYVQQIIVRLSASQDGIHFYSNTRVIYLRYNDNTGGLRSFRPFRHSRMVHRRRCAGTGPWDDPQSVTRNWKTFELTSSVRMTIDLQEDHKEWVVLGQVDLDAFVESHVTTAVGFEENFRVVRAKRKEADKLPETVKVPCVLFRTLTHLIGGAARTGNVTSCWKM